MKEEASLLQISDGTPAGLQFITTMSLRHNHDDTTLNGHQHEEEAEAEAEEGEKEEEEEENLGLGAKDPPEKEKEKEEKTEEEAAWSENPKRKYDLAVPLCKDFCRGRCSRSQLECKYAHPPPSVPVEGETVTACYDSLRDRCARGYSCRFFHPPPQLRVKLQAEIGFVPSSPAPSGFQVIPVVSAPVKAASKSCIEVCRNFVRGYCERDAQGCRFAHQLPDGTDGNYTIIQTKVESLRAACYVENPKAFLFLIEGDVCQDFLRGRCQRDECRYFHPPDHLKHRIVEMPAGPSGSHDEQNQPSAKRARTESTYGDLSNGGSSMPYLGNRLEAARSLYSVSSFPNLAVPPTIVGAPSLPRLLPLSVPLPIPLPQLPSASQKTTDQEKLPVCRDSMKNKCSRGANCKFAHPGPLVQVTDNFVTVCRDHVRGKCNRHQCKFYHPPLKQVF